MMLLHGRTRRLLGRGLVVAVGVISVLMVTRVSTTFLDAEAAPGQSASVTLTSPPSRDSYPMRAGWTKRLYAHVVSRATVANVEILFQVDDSAGQMQFRAGRNVNLVAGWAQDVYADWTLPTTQPAGRYVLRLAALGPNGDVLGVNYNATTFDTATASGGTAAAPPPSPAAVPHTGGSTGQSGGGKATPQAGQPCPSWVHDQYTTVGPDGKTYPTWHPPVDPQYGCLFGHEHGANPRTSRANSSMPAFGYAAGLMNMSEPHEGFKVFVMNAGEAVDSNVASKISDEDVRIVFHMGTSGVGRYTQPLHSMQYDVVDHSTGRVAHVTGMADTGSVNDAGSTCSNPRKGFKDFSTLGCPDTYEIWNFVRFQIITPADPGANVMQSPFAVTPSIAVFDPITTRDPSNNSRVVYTEDVKPNPAYISGADPKSPQAFFQGCRREFYSGPAYWNNTAPTMDYWTDPLGRVSANNQQDAAHPIHQQISRGVGTRPVIYKDRTDFCGNGIHAPN